MLVTTSTYCLSPAPFHMESEGLLIDEAACRDLTQRETLKLMGGYEDAELHFHVTGAWTAHNNYSACFFSNKLVCAYEKA